MTQKEKDLLLKDLCGRLPYGVMCRYQHIQYIENGKLIDINMFGRVNIDGHIKDVCDIKPYLFPLSSMTEEQKNDLTKNLHSNVFVKDEISFWCLFTANMMGEWKKVFEWCVKNHFDICGLIPKGLAIDATNLNIY